MNAHHNKKSQEHLKASHELSKPEGSEQKQSEEKLRETKDYLDNIIESSLDGILVTDNIGYVTRVNNSFMKLLGYKREEVIGKHTMELSVTEKGTYESTTGESVEVTEEFFSSIREILKILYEEGKISNWESFYLRKDNKVIPIEQNIVYLYNEEGDITGSVGVIRDITEHRRAKNVLKKAYDELEKRVEERTADLKAANQQLEREITERKRAEKKLKETKDHLNNVIKSSLDAIVVTGPTGYITRANSSFIKLLGYKQEEIIGKNVMELSLLEAGTYESTTGELVETNEESFNNVTELKETLFEEGKISNWESYLKRKDNKVVPVEVSLAFLYNEERDITGAVAINRDITERKLAERERERLLYELKDKNKELEQIFYVASHDLRSPLVNIQGFSKELEQAFKHVQSVLNSKDVISTVKGRLSPSLEEDIPEALQYIRASTAKMDSLLSGLLRLSRLGRAALKIKQLDMNKLIPNIIRTFEYKVKEKGITPQIDELPPCFGDETQINQVFSNLIDNTLKYLDPNRTGIIKISGRKDNGQAIYYVEDNGIGIAKEHQERIYEIFYRLNPEAGSGEGLGLTIARRILDRHSGKIWVESELGKGSKFFVSLPTS